MGRLDEDSPSPEVSAQRSRAEYHNAIDGLDKAKIMMRLVQLATDRLLDLDDQNAVVLGLQIANEYVTTARDDLVNAMARQQRSTVPLASGQSDRDT